LLIPGQAHLPPQSATDKQLTSWCQSVPEYHKLLQTLRGMPGEEAAQRKANGIV
jgi:hypothetical protein